MAEVICFASSKGGSGKTTITASIGTFLARSGRSVLLIDCDEGTHGLTLMFLDEVNSHRKRSGHISLGTFDVLESVTLEQLDASTMNIEENLFLLPARHVFSEMDIVPVNKQFQKNLMLIVNFFRDKFDFILLDAQAGISPASKAAMSPGISDTVILASEYDPMSNAGIERLKARLPDELDVGRTWILLNKLLPEFVSKFSEFLSVARYLPPVPWTADVVRAYSRRSLALDFEDGNQFTLAILAILRELLERDDQKRLDDWIEEQTQRLKEPIQEQLKDAEIMLAQMQKMSELEYRHSTSLSATVIKQIASGFSVVAAVTAITIGFAELSNTMKLLELFEFILANRAWTVTIGILGLLSLLTFVLQSILKSEQEKRRKIRQKAAMRYGEVDVLMNRVKELKALQSAGFEDIVAQQEQPK